MQRARRLLDAPLADVGFGRDALPPGFIPFLKAHGAGLLCRAGLVDLHNLPRLCQTVAADDAAVMTFDARLFIRPRGLTAEVAQDIFRLDIIWIGAVASHGERRSVMALNGRPSWRYLRSKFVPTTSSVPALGGGVNGMRSKRCDALSLSQRANCVTVRW